MLLNIITGGSGSGKSRYLYELIRQNLKNNPQSRAVLIVPEQSSYNAEKALTAEMGGLGINNIEVLTFTRLVHRFTDTSKNILPSGKMMLICKAASLISEENIFSPSIQKNGFLSSVYELFSEFKRYGITPDDLDSLPAEKNSLCKKARSVSEIYKNYLSLFDGSFTDGDDALELLAENIRTSGIFSDTFFFIDDYNDFLPQHCSVIRALLCLSRGVHITLGIDDEDADGLFAPVLKTEKKMKAIALSEGIPVYTKKLCGSFGKAPSDIKHLLKNWETKNVYDGKCDNISVFTARDLYSEVEHTASAIIEAVRDKGCHFRDIGVICGDIQQYLHIVNAVFADFKIPFFTDEKMPVSEHPVAKTVLSLFNILSENWSSSSVFDYLRSGYIYIKNEDSVTPIDQEDIDVLENYVLLHGIKGKKMWFSEWTKGGETAFDDVIENRRVPEYDLERLNILRQNIIAPFAAFLDNKGRTVPAIASAVYDFMRDLNLYEGILSECDIFDSCGMRDESEQFKQVWNCVLSVLDQMVITLGKGAVSRESFAAYFKNGLSQCSLSIIPSGLDRVSVGTVQRNSPSKVKLLFIIGAVHGAIPAAPSSGSIFSDAERTFINAALSEKEKELAPDNLNRMALENLKLYRIICTASEKLFVSFPASDSEGKALACAPFINTLISMFPDIKRGDNVISKPTDSELLASSKRGFYYMLTKLSEYYMEKPEKLWQSVFDWYSRRPEYRDKLEILQKAAKYKKLQPKLSRRKAELLYGKSKKYSITALEKYSKCPFSYYLEKGLHARPQEVMRVEKSHIGSLIHAAVCQFCKAVEGGAQSLSEIHRCWQELTPEKCDEIICAVVRDMKDKILPRAENNANQIEYLLSRIERTLKKSAETIRLSLASGSYTSVCYEKDFEVSIDWKGESITLLGTIDRIDIMELAAEKKVNIRIIDYKTGHKKFSVAAICNKIDMQLVLYAIAALKMYNSGNIENASQGFIPSISAIMYNRICDDIVSAPSNDLASAEKELKKQQKLDGLVILDEAETENGDEQILPDNAFNMDHDLRDTRSSDFLNINIKSDSTFSKSSQVASRRDFDLMSDYIKKAAVDTDRSIRSGNISINPYRDGANSSCAYCDFREVCMFDTKFDKYRHLLSGNDAAMEYMKKEVEDNE